MLALLVALFLVNAPDSGGCQSLMFMRNLRSIGRMLRELEEAGHIRDYRGAAFLLQMKDRMQDLELVAFRCPLDEATEAEGPLLGSSEWVSSYRDLTLPEGVEPSQCSYAGPDRRQGKGKRIWACCVSRDGVPRHEGLHVLWSTGLVESIDLEDVKGYDPIRNRVVIGPESPDPRLRGLRFD